MAKLLLSLHSKVDSKAALGIFDTDYGLTYLQIEEFSSQIKQHQIRGVAISGTRVYTVSTASLRLYTFASSSDGPWFRLDKEVTLPEWLAGGLNQADLLPLYLSQSKQRLFIGCNNLGTLDEFNLEGDFIKRQHLSEISDTDFIDLNRKKRYPHGKIVNITESPAGDLVLTIAFRSGSNNGSIVSEVGGEILLDGLLKPHAGLYSSSMFYYLDVCNGKLLAHQQRNGCIGERCWVAKPKLDSTSAIVSLRGLAIVNESVFSSILNYETDANKWISPKIVSFDALSGEQSYIRAVQGFDVFRHPRVFSMVGLSNGLELPHQDKVTVYKHGVYLDTVEPVSMIPDSIYSNCKERVVENKQSPGTNLYSLTTSESLREGNKYEILNDHVVISLRGVCLSYRRGAYFGFGKKRHLRKSREFWALKDVSFDICEGEVVGVIGRNGSGKSSLGMLLGGSLIPDRGIVEQTGKAQLLSLGVGFRGELTGRDNVFISATLLGLSRAQISEHMDDIENFSELNEFIDEPVRTYSAGMKSRLAFAIATAVEPDILILDEIMSTGDQSFRKKAEKRMRSLQERAKTILLVSHNPGQLRKLCSRVIWLDHGTLMLDGKPKQVLSQYEKFCQNPSKWLDRHKPHY